MNCAGARWSFPDLDAGPVDAEVLAHLASCRKCAEESRLFRATLEAAAGYAAAGVPDPGDPYWERFLPSVRARLTRPQAVHGALGRPSAGAKAAALLMACVAAGALLLPRPAFTPDGSAAEASSRLERVLLERPDMAPEIASDMIGLDPVLTLIDESDQTTGLEGAWEDEEFWTLIDGLDSKQAARLLAELSAEKG